MPKSRRTTAAFVLDDAPLLGTPEEIIAQLKRLEAGGVENVLFAAPGASVAGLRTFAERDHAGLRPRPAVARPGVTEYHQRGSEVVSIIVPKILTVSLPHCVDSFRGREDDGTAGCDRHRRVARPRPGDGVGPGAWRAPGPRGRPYRRGCARDRARDCGDATRRTRCIRWSPTCAEPANATAIVAAARSSIRPGRHPGQQCRADLHLYRPAALPPADDPALLGGRRRDHRERHRHQLSRRRPAGAPGGARHGRSAAGAASST